jgi:hypothetical protein
MNPVQVLNAGNEKIQKVSMSLCMNYLLSVAVRSIASMRISFSPLTISLFFNVPDSTKASSITSSDDAGPILDEAQVDEITSDDPTKLDDIVQNALEEKKRKEYSVRDFRYIRHTFLASLCR